MAANPLPLRPVNPMALIEAAEGLSDIEIGRLLAIHFPESLIPDWEPSWNPTPNSDGFRLHAIDLDRIGGYAESLPEQPTDQQIDASNARAAEGRRAPVPWPLDKMEGAGM